MLQFLLLVQKSTLEIETIQASKIAKTYANYYQFINCFKPNNTEKFTNEETLGLILS